MEFAYDGGGVGKGGTVTLYIDGDAVGDGHIEQTEAFLFSADETLRRRQRVRLAGDRPTTRSASSPARSTGSRSTSASTTTTT